MVKYEWNPEYVIRQEPLRLKRKPTAREAAKQDFDKMIFNVKRAAVFLGYCIVFALQVIQWPLRLVAKGYSTGINSGINVLFFIRNLIAGVMGILIGSTFLLVAIAYIGHVMGWK
jgi:hypothetical protein